MREGNFKRYICGCARACSIILKFRSCSLFCTLSFVDVCPQPLMGILDDTDFCFVLMHKCKTLRGNINSIKAHKPVLNESRF